MNAIVRAAEASALAMTEEDVMKVLQSSLYPGAAVDSIRMVMGYCRAAGLDVMQKPVHIVPMWDGKAKTMRDVVMPGIGLYRTQAARSGCAGVTEPEFGPDITEDIGGVTVTYPAWCRVTVKRLLPNGQVVEFTAKEFWKENYAQKGGQEKSIAPNAMWLKRPYGQLGKCAEAQALRKAFPEVGSAPTADEMMGKAINEFAEEARTILDTPRQEPAAPALYSAEQFEANFEAWAKAIASGKRTPDQIIQTVETKGKLTEQQKQRIRDAATVDAETGEVMGQ